jgi:HIRAN domain
MAICKTPGCSNETATAARHYCDECREIKKAPNVSRPGDLRPEKLFFSLAGVSHHPASRHVRQGEPLYLVRDPENPYDSQAIEVRRANGDVIGYVPRQGMLQGRFGRGPYTQQDLAAALDAGAGYSLRCYAAGGAVQAEGHCNGWMVPYPARVEVWAKRGSSFNTPREPLPFAVERAPRAPVRTAHVPVQPPPAAAISEPEPDYPSQGRRVTSAARLRFAIAAGAVLVAVLIAAFAFAK